MITQFGRVISGKAFRHFFSWIFIFVMCLAVYEVWHALILLLPGSKWAGIVAAVFAVFALLVLTGGKVGRDIAIYRKAVSFTSCFYIYFVILLLFWEAVYVILKLNQTLKAYGILGIACAAVIIVAAGYLYTKHITVKKYDLSLRRNGKNYRIALISDIHLGIFVKTNHIRKIVRKINALEADIVVIAGDLFDTDNSMLHDIDELERISQELALVEAKEGVYAVLGNHDPSADNDILRIFLQNANIELLDDTSVVLSKINLVGRNDEKNGERKELSEVMQKIDQDKPVVVLDHNPYGINEATIRNTDLILCGHTHRGQFFPVTLLTKWVNGSKYFYGQWRIGKTNSIITSGVGFFQLPIRVGTSNEIVDIHLKV